MTTDQSPLKDVAWPGSDQICNLLITSRMASDWAIFLLQDIPIHKIHVLEQNIIKQNLFFSQIIPSLWSYNISMNEASSKID